MIHPQTFCGKKVSINSYLWALIGAGIGWAIGASIADQARTARLEAVAMGIFGAVAGGDLLPSMFQSGPKAPDELTAVRFVLAAVGAVAMVLVLVLIRRVVGPMHVNKSPKKHH